MNPFESGTRKVIPAVLIYVKSADDRVLMIHRLGGEGGGKPGDYHVGKWNGLGGKLELDESPLEAARRELREESGLDLADEAFVPIGTLQFPNFKVHKNEDWLVFVLVAHVGKPSSQIRLGECAEGALHWVPSQDIGSLNLWAGDRHFISYVRSEKKFFGTIWYRGQEVERFWMSS
jgi:8-oxo-dGTP diphosphatase